jgi:hypothetical protein
MTLRIERYRNTRHWALYDGADLVVVTVYRRGHARRSGARQERRAADAARSARPGVLRHRARRAAAATRGSATGAARWGLAALGLRHFSGQVVTCRWSAAGSVKAGAHGFCAPPAGLGLERFCGATILAWPGRKEALYLTRSAPQRGCMRGLGPCMRKQGPGSPAEAEWQSSGDAAPAATLTRSR